jgi:hypothetical protein
VTHVEHNYGIQVGSDELVPENFDSITRLTDFVIGKVNPTKPSNSSLDESAIMDASASGNGRH